LYYYSVLVCSWLLGLGLEAVLTPLLPAAWAPLTAPGPTALVIPFFTPFFLRIPVTTGSRLGPVSVSSKSLCYLLGLQLGLTSPAHLACSLTSLLAGAVVHCTSLATLLATPAWLASVVHTAGGWLFDSSPPRPPAIPLGATLEIQRTQQAEAVEQQLLRARARQFNVPLGRAGRQMNIQEAFGRAGAGAVQASPALLQTLTDMGFPRARAEQALVRSNNQLDQATNLLLQDM